MKLGFVTAIVPELSLKEVLVVAQREHFGCIEVMCWPVGKAERKYAGVTHIDVTNFSQAQADDVNASCVQHRVSISALGYYPNPLDPDLEVSRTAVNHLKRVMLAAEKLGLKNVNTFVGRDWTKSIDENWPRFFRTWSPLVEFAEDHGIKIGIENCPMLFSRDEWPGGKNLAMCPAIWRRMFNDIPSKNFGLNYDPSHPVLLRFDHLKPLREFRDKLFHIHAKDVLHDESAFNDWGILGLPKQYHTPRIPGFGEIDWGQFIGTLMEVGYDGPVCIEVEDETFGKDLAGRKRAIQVARNMLQPFFANE
jgi:sugar phosphate isomerase/epimerase